MGSNPPFHVDVDEDFFDNLVDVDFKLPPLPEPTISPNANDSDVANLDIDDVANSVTNSFAFEQLDTSANRNASKAVKEVEWTAFTTQPLDGGGSCNDFFTEFGDSSVDHQTGNGGNKLVTCQHSVVGDSSQNVHPLQAYGTAGGEVNGGGQGPWENLYPGWKFDANTGQWYQVNDGFDVSQTNHANGSFSNQDHASQEDSGYPSHMVFNSQYPGWYYDMNTQEWCSLDAYNSRSIVQAQVQVNQNGFSATNTYYGNDQKRYGEGRDQDQLVKRSGFECFSSQGQDYNSKGSFTNVEQKVSTMWQPDAIAKSVPISDFRGNNQFVPNSRSTSFLVDNLANQPQSFVPIGNFNQSFSQSPGEMMMNVPKIYDSQTHLGYSRQPVQNDQQVSYATPTAGRSSAGRPHALVTFGFGGKLIVMKNTNVLINQSYGSQDSNGGSIFVHNMAEAFAEGTNVSSSYFDSLCRQSFPGPLTRKVGAKELSKWIDERITHSEFSNMDYRNNEVLKLLFSLLKIASQHNGKLRSPFGTDARSKENDAPEVAVARLFASVRKDTAGYGDYGHFTQCLQQLPSERDTRVTAAEVQTLLVSGRKMEALQRAQDGQLWGPALVLSEQLGDQYYVDTVRKMALRQLVAGSPLRTLCLLIAGQPADAFSSETTTDNVNPGAVNVSQQVQPGANCMLDDWEANLAVITANRTKDDELVLMHLGDSLWKERSNTIAAHICYLVAEANIEPYSGSARLCLIGADHWKHPRTYASPEAIQRTEVYEYAKLQENSSFTLLPFQPYKLIYAHMLAEVGRVSDSLRYCQSVSKSIKTVQAPEAETWRLMVKSLEDRIKFHQESGFSTILAPATIVGKLRSLFGSTAHHGVGGLPPPIPSTTGGHTQNEHHYRPSASLELINHWSDDTNRNITHNRSVSELDFSRSPKQAVPSKENPGGSQNKSSGGTSRFRHFGFGSQLLQKTVGLVLKPRGGDKQAKLGDTNKFYYDEKLKRWVEEGADPPAEEAALAPPPTTTTTFQNEPTTTSSSPDYNLRSALKSEGVSQTNGISEFSSHGSTSGGIPQIPPATSNQFSARGRLGVRARYVDTFNQGGGLNPTNLFQSPPTPTIKPSTLFVPTPSSTSTEQPVESPDNTQTPTSDGKEKRYFTSAADNSSSSSLQSFPQLPAGMTRQKFSSMENISEAGGRSNTRRIASWSGDEQGFSFSNKEQNMPSEVGLMHAPMISDDLQEVDL